MDTEFSRIPTSCLKPGVIFAFVILWAVFLVRYSDAWGRLHFGLNSLRQASKGDQEAAQAALLAVKASVPPPQLQGRV